jgi:aspartate aminotransferase
MQIAQRSRNITASVTLAIDAKAKEMVAQGKDIIGLGAGEPDFDTPDFIRDAAKAAMDKGLTRYTPAAGMPGLQKAICDKLLRDNGLTYKPGQIVVSCGAKHSLFIVFFNILEAGDEVLIPSPCWVSYPEQVKMVGGAPVFVAADAENDFKPTLEQWEAAVTPRSRALILNTPNNPNGCVWSPGELLVIAEFAKAHDLTIVSDEIYEHLIYDGLKHVSIASLSKDAYERTVIVNGVSNSFAMTGWRIGYTASCPALAKAMSAMQSHATSAPNTIAQAASIAALKGPTESIFAMRAEFDRRRKALCSAINAIPGLSCRLPGGAFYIMMDISGVLGKKLRGTALERPMAFADALLDEEGLAIVPGEAFMADHHCRLSYATSMDNIERAAQRLCSFIGKLTD